MEVFEPCFPRKRFRKALKEVKAIADALGERRDRDVSISALAEFGEELTAADRHGVLVMIDRLRDERSLANDRLVPHVDADRLAKLRKRIGKLAKRAQRRAA
jgi:CHAD domain-containing protein